MKKISFIAAAALAIAGFTSCDEYTLPNPPAQSNPAEAVFAASDLEVTNIAGDAINLVSALEANEQPELIQFTVNNLPLDRTVNFVMQISDTEDFAKTAQVSTNIDEQNIVRVSVYDLENAYADNFSRSLDPATIYIRYEAYIVNATGSESVRVGGPDTYFAVSSATLTPVLLGHVIEETYYLVGSFNNWQISSAIPFTKTNEGNQYDEPDFHVNVQVTPDQAEAGYQWKIIPGSAYAAGNWEGAYGAVAASETEPLNGNLVESAEPEANAGTIAEPGSYQIKVNMYKLTYSVGLAYDYLWIKANGYYGAFNRMLRLSTKNYVDYVGVMRANHTFSLYCQGSSAVGGVAYGNNADVETITGEDGITKGGMSLTTEMGNVDNMNVPDYGFYLLRANLNKLEWSAAPINSISLVGEFNGWNTADEAATMSHNNYWTVWTLNDVVLPAGEFKFCANHDWAISFGGALDNIEENGSNIAVAEAGTYDVVLDFTTIPYSATLTKK